jgi:hypothetical protein
VIGPGDRVRLPEGVVVEGGALRDPVRDAPIQLNATGLFVAARADGRTVAAIAADLSAQTGCGPERALADTRAFCAELNRRLLLNVDRSPYRLGRALSPVARGLRPEPLARRGGLGTLVPPALLSVGLGGLLALPAAAMAGPPVLPLLLGLALGLGLVLHEGGHALLLRNVPWCVAVAGLRAELLHRPVAPGRRAAVALAGPATAAAGGVAALTVAWALAAGTAALAAVPLAVQALALTVLAGDGRTACGLS